MLKIEKALKNCVTFKTPCVNSESKCSSRMRMPKRKAITRMRR